MKSKAVHFRKLLLAFKLVPKAPCKDPTAHNERPWMDVYYLLLKSPADWVFTFSLPTCRRQGINAWEFARNKSHGVIERLEVCFVFINSWDDPVYLAKLLRKQRPLSSFDDLKFKWVTSAFW